MMAVLLNLTSGAFVLAHVGTTDGPQTWRELAGAWEWEPLVMFPLLVFAWGYRRGSRRLRARVGADRGLRRWEVFSLWCGWWLLLVALVSPLHPWGRVLFAAHMTQHELLMVAAAPCLVLGRPLVALLMALHPEEARELARMARQPRLQRLWRGVTEPLVAWGLHALALWGWHIPAMFQMTLQNEWIHDLQHLSFFGTALLFWWALLHGRAGLRGFGVAVLYLFTTMAHSGALGALISLADTVVYPTYVRTAATWSLSPLEDQQLGGFIMWVPAALVYVIAALSLTAGWLRNAERRHPWNGDAPSRVPVGVEP